ncbi:hypothetical protein TNCT_317041 [Trichonephila clavata]|uniref:Uncharacterized protein n=1 Tax=Trichonephila clavata TaxID=2740835 RepID=A0A8X6G7Q3_TRICU|nr:hypothetical protein TNCT_317041 [Trichonephila clavata]
MRKSTIRDIHQRYGRMTFGTLMAADKELRKGDTIVCASRSTGKYGGALVFKRTLCYKDTSNADTSSSLKVIN